ncbi:HAD hydrolase-like protein [uncultured Umboniibacter sp.]|uniref:HAD family hydrolase n=1 Tax=uncultured Umboniibacter sp. TaxID=1798917 RepID=UPI0026049D82|nr:HAD hydrolase-like protein [uncultured Umboniibacter sp.]
MHPLFEYDLVIFDCDGVILDANQLKIAAMERAVLKHGFSVSEAADCKQYFSENFGKSRFHHVRYFVENILPVQPSSAEEVYQSIIDEFAAQCRESYADAPITPGFEVMLNKLTDKKAVASGSEQQELRALFANRGMSQHYENILGSPTAKNDNVATLLAEIPHSRAVMVGDAVADYEAAQANGIDFIAYVPYSNVPKRMKALAAEQNFPCLDEWPR